MCVGKIKLKPFLKKKTLDKLFTHILHNWVLIAYNWWIPVTFTQALYSGGMKSWGCHTQTHHYSILCLSAMCKISPYGQTRSGNTHPQERGKCGQTRLRQKEGEPQQGRDGQERELDRLAPALGCGQLWIVCNSGLWESVTQTPRRSALLQEAALLDQWVEARSKARGTENGRS